MTGQGAGVSQGFLHREVDELVAAPPEGLQRGAALGEQPVAAAREHGRREVESRHRPVNLPREILEVGVEVAQLQPRRRRALIEPGAPRLRQLRVALGQRVQREPRRRERAACRPVDDVLERVARQPAAGDVVVADALGEHAAHALQLLRRLSTARGEGEAHTCE